MRREFFLHFSFWFSFFVLVMLFKHYFAWSYWPFVLGGLVGVFLPDIDHILYVWFVKPTDLSSQRVNYLVNKSELWRSIQLLYETRSERRGLIFHTVFFQVIFLILTFWMMSSSGSLFGKGLVLSFALHLSVDQIVDLTETSSFDNWQRDLPFKLDLDKAKIYWLVVLLLVGIFGFLM